MPPGSTKFCNCLHMGTTAIALVIGKAIGREFFIQSLHDSITSDLGNNGSCSNGHAQGISVYNGHCFHILNLYRHGIDKRNLWPHRQMLQYLRHTPLGCRINIVLIYIADADDIDLNSNSFCDNLIIELISFDGANLFGVI